MLCHPVNSPYTTSSFNVHGIVYVSGDGQSYTQYNSIKHANNTNTDHIAPLEREIRDLSNSLQTVKDEQEYIVVREKVHRNTAESTNDRVKWWSILQACVLFSVCGWQIYYLRVRSFSRNRPLLLISIRS
jgi:hypothetical protein